MLNLQQIYITNMRFIVFQYCNLPPSIQRINNQIEIYKEKDRQLQKKIDSLSTADAVVVKEIQTIKEKEYVQIKVVDSMPISELQEFFTDRYPSCSTE